MVIGNTTAYRFDHSSRQVGRMEGNPMPDNQALAALKQGFRSDLVSPADASYDEARKLYNGMIDKRPRLIARCADVADVIAAVNFGRDNGLLVRDWAASMMALSSTCRQ